MYCGSLDHAKVLARFVEIYPQLVVNINLFWLSFTLNKDRAIRWQDFISWLDSKVGSGRFLATLPTYEVRNELAEYTGCILPVAPHPSTGLSDQDFHEMHSSQHRGESSDLLRVLFPSAPRPEKGYLSSVECASVLGKMTKLIPIIRHAPSLSTPKDLAKPLTDIPENVEVVEGELSDQQFLALFRRADISVLPYTLDAFAKRTSGLLIDSMYHGVPCVVVRGTWLGNIVEKYSCGEVVEDISTANLIKGITTIAQDYESYRSRTISAGLEYFSGNSWAEFTRYLLRPADTITNRGPRIAKSHTVVIGFHTREEAAHWDETSGIAQIFGTALFGTTMIDVGAHHGSALIPFLNKGWKIFAFEPDEKNRAKLLERLARHKDKELVSLDTRCVSNKSQKDVAFYQSEQSTGISGLSAFHESHVEAQRVDTITLTEFFQDKPLLEVDFLKIDTEGHDLFVLQGFPWDRTKPAVIECEFEDSKTVPLGYTFHNLAQFLVDKGYTVYVSEWHPIIRYGIRHDWNRLVRYPCQLADSKGWGNLLAFRDPIDEKDLVAAVKKVLKIGVAKGNASGTGETANPASVATRKSTRAEPARVGRSGFRVEPSAFFVPAAPNQWRYMHSDASQRIWVATVNVCSQTKGASFVGGLRLQADRAMTVNVSLGRHGKTEYEGTTKRFTLAPGAAETIKLSKEFTREHRALKLQVEVLDLKTGGSALLTIDDLYIIESLASIRKRLGDVNITLHEANRRFRDGDLGTAMGMYLLLGQQHPLKMYSDNALMAARKSGMATIRSTEDLLQRITG